MRFDPAAHTITLEAPTGAYASHFKHILLVLHGFTGVGRVSVNGAAATLTDGTWSFLALRSDAQWQPGDPPLPQGSCAVKEVMVDNVASGIRLGW